MNSIPASAGSRWTNLYGLAVASDGTLFAAGTFVDPATDNNNTLLLQGQGTAWTVDQGPNPGSGSNILGGITNAGGTLFAAGVYDDGGSRLPLVERQ